MLATDADILKEAEAWKRSGRGVALATVVETWGSAPRPVGSHLVVDEAGNFLGSVSGGCVEGAVIEEAADVIADGRPRMLEFGVAVEAARKRRPGEGFRPHRRQRAPHPVGSADSASAYGRGVMRLDLLTQLNAERAARRAAILVTDVATNEQRFVRESEAAAEPLATLLEERFRSGKSGLVQAGGRELFLTVQVPPVKVVVIGAVHISQALAPMARGLDFDVTIIDPRTAFATPERFPDVPVLAEWPDAALPRIGLDRYTAMLALTHDPKIDDPALDAALKAECFYIGALGSKKTHARRIERLTAAGFGEDAIQRIHAPIGLDIGAVSPAEIAVSILAEIVATLRRDRRRA